MKVEEGFDPDQFVSALKSVLYLKVPSDPDISSSDMSDYSDEDDGSPTSSSLDSDEDMPGGRRDELRFLDNQRNIRSASPSKTATPSQGYICSGMEAFLSHQPCIMCGMALLHSRIARVFFFDRNETSNGEKQCPALLMGPF